MISNINKLLTKYKSIIMYLIFGVLTTVVNIVLYYIFQDILSIQYLISTIIAWIGAVVFAFITNKYLVFNSKENNNFIKELSYFVLFRLLTLVFDLIIMYLLVDIMNIDDLLSKIVANVVVVVLNYIFSKLFIFKK